ncbi:MAG: isoleucine--tRNA ligase [Candidatus Omnitrophica bacterium]|nr:isoleucine--tRNA ligase [Candidatus Omnitrophota bacterium]
MSNRPEYKDTLNLPKTDFPMKADLPKREPAMLVDWQKQDIYGLIRKSLKGSSQYILHDGPPYANGDIHIGHVLNKTLKDIVVKYKTMQGFDSPYVPGWDCHGLPIEHQLFKELKIRKHQIPQQDFRQKARDYALSYVAKQKEQFKRLGVFGDWDNPYLTLNYDYEESILEAFNELVKSGYVYRGLKPVNWCFKCETALAEAEVEYDDHSSDSVFVKFKVIGREDFSDVYLVIWTTTPWTLLSNVAVAAHHEFVYARVKTDKGELIIAKGLLEGSLAKMGIKAFEVINEYTGKQLEALEYEHPFIKRRGRCVLADYVSGQEGTGLVHIAPGHGSEDYLVGLKYNLEVIMPVDNKGNFNDSTGEFKGLNCLEANKLVLEKLEKVGALLVSFKIQHSYPYCWRCKSPIIFRATKQWFLNLEHKDLRERLKDIIKNHVNWIPKSGLERILGMVSQRPDWCLSRQRYWGVPIPALVCNVCHEEFLVPEVIERFINFCSKEGSDAWFLRNLQDFLPEGFKCPTCNSNNLSKGNDILDVWFDSGVSAQAVLAKRDSLAFPASLYLEGSDQHRGWFQSSLIPSVCLSKVAPFKSVLTHGFVVDAQGRKMSKSVGNVISPFDIIKDYGADILRLWVASSDYNEDIRISKEIMLRLSEAYRKIRNTARFILSNLYDFNPDVDIINTAELKRIDRWILGKLSYSLEVITKAYDDFIFHKAYKEMYDFCNEWLSMYYLDMVKGRLYTYPARSFDRRSAQTAMYIVLGSLVRMMAPVLVFTSDEILRYMPKPAQSVFNNCVHLLRWPKDKYEQEKDLDSVIGLIPDVAKSLEEMRSHGIIGSSFDAQINLLTKGEIRYNFLASLKDDLSEVFKVSAVKVIRQDDLSGCSLSRIYEDTAIAVEKASGLKCPRCWNYSKSVGESLKHPEICLKCEAAIREEKGH